MTTYEIGSSGQRLIFAAGVIERFDRHRQRRWYHREAGGQLFARIRERNILVEIATGPRWLDRRTRHTYRPHRGSEQVEIDTHYRQDLHFVGDWHSHAEPNPQPSRTDLLSMADSFARSRHRLNAFILVIVGIHSPPRGMLVLACDATAAYELQPPSDPRLDHAGQRTARTFAVR